MRRTDGLCEDGFGHYNSKTLPPAKLCVRNDEFKAHAHVCGKHRNLRRSVRPVGECDRDKKDVE